jgi:hypothetical protein
MRRATTSWSGDPNISGRAAHESPLLSVWNKVMRCDEQIEVATRYFIYTWCIIRANEIRAKRRALGRIEHSLERIQKDAAWTLRGRHRT